MLILGDYQTGKTFLAKNAVLRRFPRRIVWDPTFAFGYGTRDLNACKERFERTGQCTYLPGRGTLVEKFDAFCEFALSQSNAMVFIDEPGMLGNARSLPRSFHDLHRLGHKRGLGVTVASHSVWDLPHVTQQHHHAFIFRITRVVDVNSLRQIVPEAAVVEIQGLPDRWFIYKNRQGWRKFRPIQV